MIYDLKEILTFINDHNLRAHALISQEMVKQKNGQYIFKLKVNAGQITDYTTNETVTDKS